MSHIQRLISSYNFRGTLHFFQQSRCKYNIWKNLSGVDSYPMFYDFQSSTNVDQDSIKSYLKDCIRLRAKLVSIRLQCLNADLSLKKHQESLWSEVDSSTIVRSLHGVKNSSEYVEKLQIKTLGISKLDFVVGIQTELIDGKIYNTCKTFSLEIEPKTLSMIERPFTEISGDEKATNFLRRQNRKTYRHTEQILLGKAATISTHV